MRKTAVNGRIPVIFHGLTEQLENAPENAFQRICSNSPLRNNVGKCMLSTEKLL